ncbi:MAG: response regulator transcription factor [Flavobacteriales bacterium]|nr:response regulator transcription factor [Flavobacteriales bacterium]MCC6939852.1 response regulator transcription factor [Flavobacteriales bacterium]
MPTAPLHIALVEDHPLMRDGMRACLEQWPHSTVVLEAEDGLAYEKACATAPPIHIAVVDLRMPNRNGFETIVWIREYQPETLVLAISFETNDDCVHRVLLCGAHGVVNKSCGRQELHTALDHLRATGPLCERPGAAPAHAHPRSRQPVGPAQEAGGPAHRARNAILPRLHRRG